MLLITSITSLTVASLTETSLAQTVLEEIVVTADEEQPTRTGDVVKSEYTGSYARITRARLEQPGTELGSLLSSVSGVQQRQSGGFGTTSTVTVRAASAAQTAVFLDGIMLNSGGDSSIDLSTLEILNLESVDIYKGNAPLQLGHGGIGGAVNLRTPISQNGSRSTLKLGLGSYSHAFLSAAHQMRNDKWDWVGSLSQIQSDNDFPFLHDNLTPLNPNDDERQTRQNNQVSRSSILLKGGHQSSASRRSDILLQVTERDLGVPTVKNESDNEASYETLKSQLQLSGTIDQWRGWNTRHVFYWHQSDSLYDDARGRVGLGKKLIDTDTSTLGVKTYWERFIDAGTFGLSIDLRKESLDRGNELDNNDNVTVDRQLLVSTAHLALMDSSEKYLLTPAIRWQQSQRNGVFNSRGVTGLRSDQPTQNESELGAQLGASMKVTPSWTLSANAGNFYREPSFTELFGNVGLTKSNPNLKPEEGINLDIGLAYEQKTVRIEATVFQSFRDELIVTSYDARGIGTTSNTGKSAVYGLELSTNWTPSSLWQINANVTLQNPRNLNPSKEYSGKLAPGEARQRAYARVQYQPSDVAYWYEWQAARTLFYDSHNLLQAEDTSLHHFGLDLKRGPWKFSARLENATNDNVEDYNGFPKPGRSYSFDVTRTL